MPELVPTAPASPFIWGSGGAQLAPEQVTAQQKIANLMMQQGLDYSPVQHWTQGAARVAQAMLGGYMSKEADDEAKAIKVRDRDALLGVIGASPSGAVAPVAAPAAAPVATPDIAGGGAPIPAAPVARVAAAAPAAPAVLGAGGAPAVADAQSVYGADAVMMPPSAPAAGPDYSKAIASIETGGQANPYTTIGPANAKGQRPIGKYQVMDFNVPSWTREVLGQEMTPQAFAASPEAQEAVFKNKFGQYVAQTGNPQDAASMWFTGRPLAEGANRRDVLGTSGQSYVQKFTKNLGQQAPAAVAAVDPAAIPPNAMPTEGTAPPALVPQPASAPAVSPGVATVAAAMKPGGIPENQKADIKRLLSTTPGSPAYQLGMQLVGKAVAKEREEITPMTPAERTQWQVPSGMSAGIDRSTGKPVFSPASTNVAVTSVADPIAAGVGKQFDEGLKNARTASREVIPIIHDARAALDSGAFTGSASDVQLALQKVGSVFGMDNKTAANTETFRATIGRQVLSHAKTLGANPSNADREFIREVEGGSGKMEETTLRRLLDLSEKYARTSIRNHNADASRLLAVQPDAYKGVAPLLSVDEPGEYQRPAAPPVATAGPPTGTVRKYNPATGKIE